MKRKAKRFYITPKSKKKAKPAKLLKHETALHGAQGLPSEREEEQTAPSVVETRGDGQGSVQTKGEISVRGADEEHVSDVVDRLRTNEAVYNGENQGLLNVNKGMAKTQEAWIAFVKAQVEAERIKLEAEDKFNKAKDKYIQAIEDAQVEAEKIKRKAEDKVNKAKDKYIQAMEDMSRTALATLKRSN